MATAETTDNIMVQKSVKHKYFSPPCGGFFSLGMIHFLLTRPRKEMIGCVIERLSDLIHQDLSATKMSRIEGNCD